MRLKPMVSVESSWGAPRDRHARDDRFATPLFSYSFRTIIFQAAVVHS